MIETLIIFTLGVVCGARTYKRTKKSRTEIVDAIKKMAEQKKPKQ